MWIEEFREKHGIDRHEFARRVRVLGARKRRSRPISCSENLVYLLERMSKPRTHPEIANLIAEACGATAEERDSIVAEKHRGTWTGDGVPKALEGWRFQKINVIRAAPAHPVGALREVDNRRVYNGKPVVRIDRQGRITARYPSMSVAAVQNLQSLDVVERRAKKRIRDEFTKTGYSFRYAAEWDAMNDEARLADLRRVGRCGK